MNKKSLTSIRKDILKLLIEIGENLSGVINGFAFAAVAMTMTLAVAAIFKN